jgi:hypothetical protein
MGRTKSPREEIGEVLYRSEGGVAKGRRKTSTEDLLPTKFGDMAVLSP